jgi:hypothetical protein
VAAEADVLAPIMPCPPGIALPAAPAWWPTVIGTGGRRGSCMEAAGTASEPVMDERGALEAALEAA